MSYLPTVTVITVTYNSVNEIESTIQSVLTQTYPKIEYIIIDGGSTDGTLDTIKKYQDRITYWISEPDKGIYDAMNKAVIKAHGEWVIFMNSGDAFYSDKTLSQIFKTGTTDIYKQYGILYGDRCNIYHNRKEIIKAEDIQHIENFMPFCHQAALTRTHLIREMPFDTRYQLGADYDFFLKSYHKGVQFKKINLCIANYESEHGVSSTHVRQAKKESLQLRFNNKLCQWLPRYLVFDVRYTIGNILRSINLKS